MKEIVGVSLSRFHDSEDQFEFLISYADGREIGHEVSRRAALAIHKELSENLDLGAATPPPSSHVEGDLEQAACLIKDAFEDAGNEVGGTFARRLASEIMMLSSPPSTHLEGPGFLEIAKLAGIHDIRYPTNAAMQSFLGRILSDFQGEWEKRKDPALVGIAETMKESGGHWKPCSGCYDTEDGHPTQRYPFSKALGCDVGCGCHECGGLGAVWEHWTEEDLAEFQRISDEVDREHKLEVRIARLEAALRRISSPSQTTDLLWWQVEARAALATTEGSTDGK